MLPVTRSTRLASEQTNLEPQIVLEIEGVSTIYGARVVRKKIRYGDPGLKFGGGAKFGGSNDVEDQSTLITLDGTTTSLKQQLNPDKGSGSSVSSLTIALVDKDQEISALVSPGVVVDDILGRRAKVYLGFANVAFPRDYVTVFRGIIDDIQAQPGKIMLTISHPDQKKRQVLFPKYETELDSAMDDSETYPDLVSETGLLEMLGRDYGDEGMNTYLKIDDELMETRRDMGDALEVSRGALGTIAAAHDDEAEVTAMYRLKGNVMDLALKLMLSQTRPFVTDYGSYLEGFPVSSFVFVNADEAVENSLFFKGTDLFEKYGVTAGDFMATTDTDDGANLFSGSAALQILQVDVRADGTLVTVKRRNDTALTLVDERNSGALAYFVSRYNTLGTGLGMKPDEVDIEEHELIKRRFLSSFEVEIFMEEDENVKELIEKELYAVAGAYSLPRKSKASVGMHVGPIPTSNTKILSRKNIKNPSKIEVRRSIANNFYNSIIYKWDKELFEDEFAKGLVTRSEDSVGRIPVGTKAFLVESRGLRSSLNAQNLAVAASNRRLNRYKFAAEYIEKIQVSFKVGFDIEIGDIILLDAELLQMLNSSGGNRSPDPKLYEVVNKTMDLKTGDISLALVDTNFSTASRYGLVGPSSKIKSGISQTEFIVEQFYSSPYGIQEGKKWERFFTAGTVVAVKVRSSDFTTRFAQTIISDVRGNRITVRDALGFTPQAGDVMELANYDYPEVSDQIKLLYAHATSDSDTTFANGDPAYQFL